MKTVGIIGTGNFGLAIATLAAKNQDVLIYGRRAEVVRDINQNHEAKGIKLPENIKLISDSTAILPEVDIIISVIPCQFIGGAFAGMKDSLKNGVAILNLSK